MPRVYLNAEQKKEYKLKDIKGWVASQMRVNHLNQSDLAKELGITQSRVSQLLKVSQKGEKQKDDIRYGDLLILFRLFGTAAEDKDRLLTL